MRKQQHIANRRRIGQEHDQSIHSQPQARGRRHAVFERAHVVGIEMHGFIVARILAPHLRPEPLRLLLRIIELGEAISELAAGEKKLEAVGQERIGIVGARERRDLQRVGIHKRRIE